MPVKGSSDEELFVSESLHDRMSFQIVVMFNASSKWPWKYQWSPGSSITARDAWMNPGTWAIFGRWTYLATTKLARLDSMIRYFCRQALSSKTLICR